MINYVIENLNLCVCVCGRRTKEVLSDSKTITRSPKSTILFLSACIYSFIVWTEKQTHIIQTCEIGFRSGNCNSNLFLLLVSSIIAIYMKCIPCVCVLLMLFGCRVSLLFNATWHWSGIWRCFFFMTFRQQRNGRMVAPHLKSDINISASHTRNVNEKQRHSKMQHHKST